MLGTFLLIYNKHILLFVFLLLRNFAQCHLTVFGTATNVGNTSIPMKKVEATSVNSSFTK